MEPTPMSHVTVTVVTEGVTTTYDIPVVVAFAVATAYGDPAILDGYRVLSSPGLKSVTFSMRPLKDGPDGKYLTVTRRDPSDV